MDKANISSIIAAASPFKGVQEINSKKSKPAHAPPIMTTAPLTCFIKTHTPGKKQLEGTRV